MDTQQVQGLLMMSDEEFNQKLGVNASKNRLVECSAERQEADSRSEETYSETTSFVSRIKGAEGSIASIKNSRAAMNRILQFKLGTEKVIDEDEQTVLESEGTSSQFR